MPSITRFMVQAYRRTEEGDFIAEEPQRFDSPQEAESRAEELGSKCSGVVAYSWTGDMKNGETGKIKLLTMRGAVPVFAAIALGIEDVAA